MIGGTDEPLEKRPRANHAIRHDKTWLSADDLYLFNEGNHYRLFEKLGAHPAEADGRQASGSPSGPRAPSG